MDRPGCPLRERPFSDRSQLFCRLWHERFDVDEFAALAATAKRDSTVGQCKQRVVLAEADVGTRIDTRSALANDDVAGDDGFAAELLDAETSARGIATVA